MNEAAISRIQTYINESLAEPKVDTDSYDFMKWSYSRWAAEEINEYLSAQEPILPWEEFSYDPKTPVEVITEFINKMDCFLATSENEDHRFIFSIAREAAFDILWLFVKGEEYYETENGFGRCRRIGDRLLVREKRWLCKRYKARIKFFGGGKSF